MHALMGLADLLMGDPALVGVGDQLDRSGGMRAGVLKLVLGQQDESGFALRPHLSGQDVDPLAELEGFFGGCQRAGQVAGAAVQGGGDDQPHAGKFGALHLPGSG